MTEFKNMKIEINDDQTLADITNQLIRLGYYQEDDPVDGVENFVHTYECGGFDFWFSDLPNGKITTLTELKEMNP